MSNIKKGLKKFDLDKALDSIDLTFPNYKPTTDSLEFFALMRMVQGEDFEFNTPMWHYWLVDVLFGNVTANQFPYSKEVNDSITINKKRIAIVASRGLAKSTVVTAFYPIYCAIKGKLPDGGKTQFHLLLAASAQGGGRVLAKSVQSLCEESAFCLSYFETMEFTESESRFTRKGTGKTKNRMFLIRYMGIGGGIRGVRDHTGTRPDHIIFDDVILNSDAAYSETIMNSLRNTINADAINALVGGGKGKIFSVATPFHLLDPIIETLTGGAYTPVAMPICENIYEDMPESEFKGAWPSMHPYDAVLEQYHSSIASNATREFNQERMLRISSEEDRMIQDEMIEWYSRKTLLKELYTYNIYITTDFTTTSEAKSDFSAMAVWAINSNRDYFLVDLCVRRQGIAEQYNELFRMVNFWSSQGKTVEVGVEVDGQQKAHLFALKEMMVKRSEWFTFARQKGSKIGSQGILSRASGGNKHERFRMMLPQFQNHKIHFPVELEDTPDMKEALQQIKHATWAAFGGHDDFCFVAGTKIKLADGSVKCIEDIGSDDVQTYDSDVLTSQAFPAILTRTKEVLKYTLSDGFSFEATTNHPVLTKSGWKEIGEITSNDYLIKDVRCNTQSLGTHGQNNVMGTTKIPGRLMGSVGGYINLYGNRLMGYSLKGLMYITKTLIKITTP